MDSALFEHDPQELQIWLDALPRSSRSPHARGPENEELVDEKDTVVAILDKAVRECIKTPWQYLEATLLVYTGFDVDGNEHGIEKKRALEGYSSSSAASPLLMALLELFAMILRGELKVPSSSALYVATYLRQVIFGISLKQSDSSYALRIVSNLESARAAASHESHTQSILKAIDREIRLLRGAISAMDSVPTTVNMDLEEATVSLFLQQVEALKPGKHRYFGSFQSSNIV
jgi:nucleolar pre-ribosomal-associated protein 1